MFGLSTSLFNKYVDNRGVHKVSSSETKALSNKGSMTKEAPKNRGFSCSLISDFAIELTSALQNSRHLSRMKIRKQLKADDGYVHTRIQFGEGRGERIIVW